MRKLLFDKDHYIYCQYVLKGGKLVYRTSGPQHAYAANYAMKAKRRFKVTAMDAQLAEFAGTVKSTDLVAGVKPAMWEIVMVVAD